MTWLEQLLDHSYIRHKCKNIYFVLIKLILKTLVKPHKISIMNNHHTWTSPSYKIQLSCVYVFDFVLVNTDEFSSKLIHSRI